MLRKSAGLWCAALVLAALAAAPAEAGSGAVKLMLKEGFGSYLADGNGMALYYCTRDRPGAPSCTGPCLERWPLFATDLVEPGPGLDGRDFDVAAGQATFRGHPLYYFLRDAVPGETTGDGYEGVWFLVYPATFPAEP